MDRPFIENVRDDFKKNLRRRNLTQRPSISRNSGQNEDDKNRFTVSGMSKEFTFYFLILDNICFRVVKKKYDVLEGSSKGISVEINESESERFSLWKQLKRRFRYFSVPKQKKNKTK